MPEVLDTLHSPNTPITDTFDKLPHHTSTDTSQIQQKTRPFKIEDLLNRQPIEICSHDIIVELFEKVILITGAAGSIGSQLVQELLRFSPRKLILLDHSESGIYELELRYKRQPQSSIEIEPVLCNITDNIHVHQIFCDHRPDIVFHAAAYKHVPLMQHSPYSAVNNNIFGTKTIADISAKFGVQKFIFISTDKAVNPSSIMGATKRIAEMYLKELNANKGISTRYMMVRFGNVFGSTGSVVPLFESQISTGGPVTVTHPQVSRYFMTIEEAVMLILQTAALGNGGETFLFDMGNPIKIVDLAKKMIQLRGNTEGVIDIVFTGLRVGEKLDEEITGTYEYLIPSEHPKIKLVMTTFPIVTDIAAKLTELKSTIETGNPAAIVLALQSITPESSDQMPELESRDAK